MNDMSTPLKLDVEGELRSAFEEAMKGFLTSPGLQVILGPTFSRDHYASLLREIYHYTKEDPQLQALASVYFRGADREMVKPFLRHAISEVGHEKLALQDLATLEHDCTGIERSNPLPATTAFTAYGFYTITFGNPVSYLGYLYFLEFLPTQYGHLFAGALAGAGVPESAMTFLHDHRTVDVGHNQAMTRYLAELVRTRKDLDDVIYTVRVSAVLYAQLYQAAIERVSNPVDFGIAWAEVARLPA
jgi:hypothetical protein